MTYGDNGGGSFELQEVRSIGFRNLGTVGAIWLNDNKYGGDLGEDTPILVMDDDEFITYYKISADPEHLVQWIGIKTNKGRHIESGTWWKGGVHDERENIRVLRIGGRTGSMVDQLSIEFCPWPQ